LSVLLRFGGEWVACQVRARFRVNTTNRAGGLEYEALKAGCLGAACGDGQSTSSFVQPTILLSPGARLAVLPANTLDIPDIRGKNWLVA
jgi:hypothetical protein